MAIQLVTRRTATYKAGRRYYSACDEAHYPAHANLAAILSPPTMLELGDRGRPEYTVSKHRPRRIPYAPESDRFRAVDRATAVRIDRDRVASAAA
jgi:hypothetical protein